jgi:phthalate 4,5-dioxygenase
MPYGHCIAAGRDTPEGQKYWRITQQLLPTFAMTGPYGPDPKRMWRAWVPIDDGNVLVFGLQFHPLRPLTQAERDAALARSSVWNISAKFRAEPTSRAFGSWYANATLENDFFQDRDAQRTATFSGIPEFWAQDASMQVSMGTVCDRSLEHLGRSDLAIISVRKRLLAAAKALRDEGAFPPEPMQPGVFAVRSDAVILAPGVSWFDATKERRAVVAGTNPDCP